MQTCDADNQGGPCRVLVLNTQHHIGADLSVHLMLLRHLDPARTQAILLSNRDGPGVEELRECIGRNTAVEIRQLPFGKHAGVVGRKAAVASLAPLAGSLIRTAGMIRRKGIQIVHATDRPRDAACAVLLGRLTGAAVVLHMHSNCGTHLERLTCWGLRRATAMFAVSEYIRRELTIFGLDPQRVFTVHNAVDADRFAPEPFAAARAQIRIRHGIPEKAPLIGIVARLNPWKGQRELIDALAELSPRMPALRLMVIGTGLAECEQSLRDHALRRGVADRVIFTGLQRDVRPLLAAMDMFALPSYEEPFGLAIIEAMAMGLPVIACRSGGVPEIIEDDRDGCLVTPRSAQELAKAIHRLSGDRERRECLGNRARETVRARFSPAAQAQHVSCLYAYLAARAGTSARPRRRRPPLSTAAGYRRDPVTDLSEM